MFHTLYNVSTMFLLLPFTKFIARFMEKIIPSLPESETKVYEKKLLYLDAQMSQSPSVATHNAQMEIRRMGNIANENFALAIESFFEKNPATLKTIRDNEKVIDYLNHKITSRLAAISGMTLSAFEASNVSKMLVILSDIERIGDHAVNIAAHTSTIITDGLKISPAAIKEISKLAESVNKINENALNAYVNQDKTCLPQIKSASKKIDKKITQCVDNHIERLKSEECEPAAGVIFTAIINDLQRCAHHAKNIAFSVALERKWNK